MRLAVTSVRITSRSSPFSLMRGKSVARTLSARTALSDILPAVQYIGGGGQHQRGHSFSTLSSPSFVSTKNDDRDKQHSSSRLQVRSFHASRRNEIIAPFIPEMILFVVVAGGWTAYRTYHGKPLTPDEALHAQEAFRKHQERLQQQKQRQSDRATYNAYEEEDRQKNYSRGKYSYND